MPATAARPNARTKLLDAALSVIRTKGFSATTVDDLCQAAGVTKGAFFHHFASKEALGVAAADHWSDVTGRLFATAPYHAHPDPLDRVLGYLDFRKALLTGDVPDFTCLVGTMVQETYDTAPAIRDACDASISTHAGLLVADIDAAMRARGIAADWTAQSLALHTQAVLQGAFILAKARGGPQIALDSVDHLIRYVKLLFEPAIRTHTKGNSAMSDQKTAARKITVETTVAAPIETVWVAYTTPADIMAWNFAADDWHCPAASADLREGGAFSSRMEAKDGSQGFDFAGTYTRVEPQRLIEYAFGDRSARVEFAPGPNGVLVRVTFDPETEFSVEMQRGGWQAILDNFRRHAEAK